MSNYPASASSTSTRWLTVVAAVLAFQVSATAGYLVSAEMSARSERSEADDDAAPAWSQWRGPDRDGRIEGARWPDTLEGLEPMWRVELGKGYGGPIVSADRVFVMETIDETLARVRALDRETGE